MPAPGHVGVAMPVRACLFAFAIVAFSSSALPSRSFAADWTWIAGDSTLGSFGTYGTKGLPAPANAPGARVAGAGTLDCALVNDWLFGGYGYAAPGSPGLLNDLWSFDGSQWTWVSGSAVINALPVYGTRGAAAPANVPGARYYAASCSDPVATSEHPEWGNLRVFGGLGYDSTGQSRLLNDLWKFDGTIWTWVSGGKLGNVAGNYGSLGIAAVSNVPGARMNAYLWCDPATGYLWLFGGYGLGATPGAVGYLNDLWRWDGTYWTWIAGSNVINQGGGLGPAARARVLGFSSATLRRTWIFGGYGFGSGATLGELNDLWHFDAATVQWTRDGGSLLVDQHGVYGTPGVPAAGNQPGGRDGGVMWRTSEGSVWLYGGYGFSGSGAVGALADLWQWDGTYWTFVKGATSGILASLHGTKGVAASAVTPGSRYGAAGWYDPASDGFRLFGGQGYDSYLGTGYLNDVYSLVNPAAAVPPPAVGASAIRFCGPNPATRAVRLRYTVGTPGRVSLTVLDLAGRVVASPLSAWQEAGEHEATWDGARSDGRRSPGIYFLRVTLGGRLVGSRRAVVLE
jgi:N-acetylneuraminic acid mutarotase